MSKKAVVFDMDECIGCFRSLWPFFDLYKKNYITDYNSLIDIVNKTVLPGCLRPDLFYLLAFLEILKKKKKVTNIFLYTNNGNYFTVKNKQKDKKTFPNFIIDCIHTHFKLLGLFDLVMETVFMRKVDAKNNIKDKYIDDLKIHGYELNQILIFDDNKHVWKTGYDRVVHVSQFFGLSDYFSSKTNLVNLSNMLHKIIKNKDVLAEEKILDNLVNFLKKEKTKGNLTITNHNDKEIKTKFIPTIVKFLL